MEIRHVTRPHSSEAMTKIMITSIDESSIDKLRLVWSEGVWPRRDGTSLFLTHRVGGPARGSVEIEQTSRDPESRGSSYT